MAKKSRKKSFFSRAVEVSNNQFKGIFEDIVTNAKNNSEVDLRLVEPNITEAIKEVAKEMKKDKKNAGLKVEELKGIISNSFGALKAAIKNDKNNKLSDDMKDDWLKELEEMGLSELIDDLNFEEDDEDTDDHSEESFSSEGDKININHVIKPHDVERACAGAVVILAGIEDPEFKDWIARTGNDLTEIVAFRVSNNVESPVVVTPDDKQEVDAYATMSMEIINQYVSMEDGMMHDEDVVTEIDEKVDEIPEPEYEVHDNTTLKESIMTEDVMADYQKTLDEADKLINSLLTVRERCSNDELNIIDLSIAILMKVYQMFKEDLVRNGRDVQEECCSEPYHDDFISFVMASNALPFHEIGEALESNRSMTVIELGLITLINIDVLPSC